MNTNVRLEINKKEMIVLWIGGEFGDQRLASDTFWFVSESSKSNDWIKLYGSKRQNDLFKF